MPAKPKPLSATHPFDRQHGTETSGLLPASVIVQGTAAREAELTAYYGIAPSILHGVIDMWLQRTHPPLSIEHYTFLDVGAGKGRAVMLAAAHPFLHVQGVELNPALTAIATANLERYTQSPAATLLAPFSIVNTDATSCPLPQTPTLAFLFHPFEAPILRRFLRHVARHLAAHPHPFDLLYVNAEHGSLLDRNRAFRKVWEGRISMSTADHLADLEAIAQQKEYGSTGDELCMIYRFCGQKTASPANNEHL